MDEEKKWAEIDDYLLNRLDQEQKAAFEAQMDRDKQLREAVEVQKNMIQGMKEYDKKQQFFQMLNEAEASEETKGTGSSSSGQAAERDVGKGPRIRWLRPVAAIAAGVAIIILAWTFFRQNTDSAPQLAQTYFEQSEDFITPQLNAQGLANNLSEEMTAVAQRAIQAFKDGELDEAENQFRILKQNFDSRTYLSVLTDLYLGQIAWKDGRFDEALDLLLPLSTLDELPVEGEIQYYTALCYLAKDQPAEAIPFLRRISADHDFHAKARELLSKLE